MFTCDKSKFIKNNEDVFEGQGTLLEKVLRSTIEVAVPDIKPARRVPIAIKNKLKETVEWINNLVIYPTHGEIKPQLIGNLPADYRISYELSYVTFTIKP